jgi:hypothetical protein
VDRLFVDEAHNYKNLFLYTKMRNVAGLSTSDAQKSSDMFAKCRYMDEITGSRGVIFATGTPVSNSMTELYTMQRYLQYDRLQELSMTHFDCWASRFGETTTALELAPEGTGYRARTRFSKFFNLPELMNLFKEVADIKTADQLHLPTPEVEYHNIVAQPTEQQQEMVKALSERASLVHSGTVDPSQDNMLKITSDGRKLGLDQRIINQALPDEPGTKVNQCVANIMQIWRDGEADKLTQLVFCDISTPQASPSKKAAKALDNPTLHALEQAVPLEEPEPVFTIYDDIRQKLIAQGKPADLDELLKLLRESGCEVSGRGKSYRLKLPGWSKVARLDSLGDGYTLEDLLAVLAGQKEHTPRQKPVKQADPSKVNLLVDIQAKLQAGKGAGYVRWAKVFNLKQMAQTVNYLTEHNLLEYAVLEEKAAAATAHHNELSSKIKAAEKRMAEIAVLRTHIINYAKTRDTYVAYRKAGYSKKFREEHEEELLLHQAAKKAFDDMGVKKLPKVKELQAEYARLLEKKKKTYAEYRRSREEMRELLAAKANVDRLLNMEAEHDAEKEKDRDQR